MGFLVNLAESGLLPDLLVRYGIRQICGKRLDGLGYNLMQTCRSISTFSMFTVPDQFAVFVYLFYPVQRYGMDNALFIHDLDAIAVIRGKMIPVNGTLMIRAKIRS